MEIGRVVASSPMAPYRSRREPGPQREAPKTGLVADMVRQFADVFAFLRELVQNGIDAGATAIEVTVDRASDGVTSVRVADDGCGMTLDVIENALLVLFRSTKDDDPTKIGKYGVGFMSVFAIGPSEVTVDTWREGHAYRVRLFPDHSYEIEQGAPRDGHGSCVAVTKTVPTEGFDAFWQDVTSALHRWCRHAELPVHFTLVDGVTPEPRRARADVPFDVRAVVSVRQRHHDGMEIVVGPIVGSGALPATGTGEDDPAPFAGFYNRGLTLHETTEALGDGLSHVRVKVKSSSLLHTLSRDDVRRDQAFHLAVARASALCSGALRAEVLRRLAAEAEKTARGEAATLLANLVEIALAPPISADVSEIPVPLAHPTGGQSVMTPVAIHSSYSTTLGIKRKAVFATTVRSELTAALAAHGIPVAWIEGRAIVEAIERASGGSLCAAPVADECLVARELQGKDRLPGDDALCTSLGEALAQQGVERVAIGHLLEKQMALGVLVQRPAPGAIEHVVVASAARLGSAKWTGGSLLVLNAAAEAVDCARRATSPAIAAHLLARCVLLAGPGLSSRASAELAVRALEQIR
jgi:hypothetical protein